MVVVQVVVLIDLFPASVSNQYVCGTIVVTAVVVFDDVLIAIARAVVWRLNMIVVSIIVRMVIVIAVIRTLNTGLIFVCCPRCSIGLR